MEFHEGIGLEAAVERLAPIVGLPADQIAGFVIVAIPADDGAGPSVAASDNVPPEAAALLLGAVARVLTTAAAMHRARHDHGGGLN